MIVLAYALFILMFALPYLVVLGLGWAFVQGVSLIASGDAGSVPSGLAMAAASLGAALMLLRWSIKAPGPTASKPHRLVFETYRSIRASGRARRWLRDGTLQRPAAEQKRPEERDGPARGDDRS
jgi:hypothetical protein